MSALDVIERKIISHAPTGLESTLVTQTLLQAAQMKAQQKRKTLILDLDETLVHSGFQKPEWYDCEVPVQYNGVVYTIYVQKRPGLDQFLRTIVTLYDTYIFTASMPEYAIPVVQKIFPEFPVNRILSRYHCRLIDGMLVKDLTIFKRDLAGMVIVDNSPQCYNLQPENGVEVTTWVGDLNDDELLEYLLPLLIDGVEADDIRQYLYNAAQ
ncbi:NLI interacting factor-like phosphatase family protein [Trichomonas vaginalis G3]|uniref:NLI interacting factor-like phosphatase family protein n=1 Tax=Trichomonas vaginalis (strain ATCC PRA-98 / G3) TaxID=412133 RepID=A2DWZ4_TRIV3|nr:phosphoprotein phosphatase protein [Trichomonas vaginalis G3]EAY15021.1 NLI interacting factor-like phosphatase family protein [Trichomonas vaginalis G3]KAI5549562.1 phosphoprotein phosphatase protein [Trichomonas vaginalis G3]|eukprot:XP_001327244.1 NLI interacting factor-like phosphatase family protein [Trichomonas vaginalis G3]